MTNGLCELWYDQEGRDQRRDDLSESTDREGNNVAAIQNKLALQQVNDDSHGTVQNRSETLDNFITLFFVV